MLVFGASITGEARPEGMLMSSGFRRKAVAERSSLCGKAGRWRDEREMVDWRRPVRLDGALDDTAESGSEDSVAGENGGGAAAAAAFAASAALASSSAFIRFFSRSRSRWRTLIARSWQSDIEVRHIVRE